MQRTRLADVTCSIARALDVVGEWWTLLVVRDLALGVTRFEDIRRDLGIASNVLTDRLDTLLTAGVVSRRPYQTNPVRHEYTLTPKGADLMPVLYALLRWGDTWSAGESGVPMVLRHDRCGHRTSARVVCSACGEDLRHGEVTALPGPGGSAGAGTAVLGRLLANQR
jgi:DNA-binding HxlR family transcriptional regulator